MKPEDVLKKYKSKYRFSKETGMAAATLFNWIKWGYIPANAQYRLELITNGELKTDWSNKASGCEICGSKNPHCDCTYF